MVYTELKICGFLFCASQLTHKIHLLETYQLYGVVSLLHVKLCKVEQCPHCTPQPPEVQCHLLPNSYYVIQNKSHWHLELYLEWSLYV